jgi:hypothetical protein
MKATSEVVMALSILNQSSFANNIYMKTPSKSQRKID